MTGTGQNIAAVRKYRGLSQKALADRAGISQELVSGYERGIRRPTAAGVGAIAKVLDVPMSDLIEPGEGLGRGNCWWPTPKAYALYDLADGKSA